MVKAAGTGEENDEVFDIDDLSDGDDNMFAQPAAQQEEAKNFYSSTGHIKFGWQYGKS